MTKTRKLIQQRPSLDVAFYTPENEVINLINSYSGNYQSTTSEDGLVNTITFTLSNENYDLIKDNSISVNAKIARTKYCADNLISFSVEEI